MKMSRPSPFGVWQQKRQGTYTWSKLLRNAEKSFYVFLAFSNIHVVDLCSTNLQHGCSGLFGNSFGKQSLSSAGRAIKKKTRSFVGSKDAISKRFWAYERQACQSLQRFDGFNRCMNIIECCPDLVRFYDAS